MRAAGGVSEGTRNWNQRELCCACAAPQGGGGDFSAAEIATADVVYEIARGQRMRKKQVS